MAFQATKQREGGPVENIGPSNNALKQVGNTIIDDAAVEAFTYLSAQPGPSGFNLVILIDTASAQYGTDISVKGDFTDRASYRGKLDGVIVDPTNEIVSNVEWTVTVTNKTTITRWEEVGNVTTDLGGNPNTSGKVIDLMVNDAAAQFVAQLGLYGPDDAAATDFRSELQTVEGNEIRYRIIEV